MDAFQAKQKLFEELGWLENPFVKDLHLGEDFLSYYYPLDAGQVLNKLAFDSKACMLLGPKGVGKTSALYYVYHSLSGNEFDKFMFKEPPAALNELADELGFDRTTGIKFLPFLTGKRDVTRQELARFLRLKTDKKKIVLLIDEAQLKPDMYMEFKYLLDEVSGLRMVFSSLDKSKFPDSLLHLIGNSNIFSRNGFSKQEMLDIINHRVKAVGGKALPFSQGVLDEVLDAQNLLSPRYVFDELNTHLAKLALGDEKAPYAGDMLIQSAIMRAKQNPQLTDYFTTSHAPWWLHLSPSQRAILAQLLAGDGLTLQDLMQRTSLTQNTVFNA
ncbi:hypothetical protein HY571_00810, partial [Candidatus Micrarchaeota archaeon]|nr:hypothetical protein [Candidatus Micrarchaeota archaeon]